METFSKPIKCPECNKLLKIVQVEQVTVYEWGASDYDPDEKEFADNGQGSTIVRCYNCGKVIGESTANNSWGLCPEITD